MVRWLSVSQEGKKILPEKEQSKRILKHRFNGELHKLRHEMGIGNSQIKKVNQKKHWNERFSGHFWPLFEESLEKNWNCHEVITKPLY